MNFFQVIFFVFMFIAGSFMLTLQHEYAHQVIYESYGISSHIEWFSHFPVSVVTVADKPCPNQECVSEHNFNEVVGYTFGGFYYAITLLALAIILICGGGDKHENNPRAVS